MATSYRKVGRGGAGNYYSQQDIQDASKRAAEVLQNLLRYIIAYRYWIKDLEAQRLASSHQASGEDNTTPRYASSGRGGAGNVTDATLLAAAIKDTVDVTPALQESKQLGSGLHGRGGAGNYTATELASGEPEEREMQEMRREEVVKDVEAGLKPPEKAHLGIEKLTYDTPD